MLNLLIVVNNPLLLHLIDASSRVDFQPLCPVQIEKDLEIEDKIVFKLIFAIQSASKFVRSYHSFSERERK
jgi:hypothetical protein